MKIYSVTIRGHKFYFTGDLPPSIVKEIDLLCGKLSLYPSCIEPAKLFAIFSDSIRLNFGYSITSIGIDHVFRVNFGAY